MQRGTSLVEILVSLFLVSITLLGMNAMLFDALRTTESTYEKSVAVQQSIATSERSRGFALIELMIVISISMILMSVLTQVYLSTARCLRTQSSLSHIQENAETAFALLRSNVHHAGYIGCAKLNNQFPIMSHTQDMLTPDNKLMITSHDLTVRYQLFPSAVLISPMTNQSYIVVSDQPHFSSSHQIVLISDCLHAEIAQIASVKNDHHQQEIQFATPLVFHYAPGAEIGKYEVNHFYIAKTKQMQRSGRPVYALYKKDGRNVVRELIDGIEDMTLQSDAAGVTIQLTLDENGLMKKWSSYAAI